MENYPKDRLIRLNRQEAEDLSEEINKKGISTTRETLNETDCIVIDCGIIKFIDFDKNECTILKDYGDTWLCFYEEIPDYLLKFAKEK